MNDENNHSYYAEGYAVVNLFFSTILFLSSFFF